MATQTYASTGNITVPSTAPNEEGGNTVLNNSYAQNELHYTDAIARDAQLFGELQNFIALWTRATATGLAWSPREVMFRLSQMLHTMLTNTKPA